MENGDSEFSAIYHQPKWNWVYFFYVSIRNLLFLLYNQHILFIYGGHLCMLLISLTVFCAEEI